MVEETDILVGGGFLFCTCAQLVTCSSAKVLTGRYNNQGGKTNLGLVLCLILPVLSPRPNLLVRPSYPKGVTALDKSGSRCESQYRFPWTLC